MKKSIFFAFVNIVLAASCAHAQTSGASAGMNVDVPFDFIAGDVTLHAGNYTIRTVGVDGDTLLLRSADMKEAVLVSPTVLECGHSNKNQLVFKVEGSRHYLWQISTSGDDMTRELPVRNRENQKPVSKKGSREVTVAALGR